MLGCTTLLLTQRTTHLSTHLGKGRRLLLVVDGGLGLGQQFQGLGPSRLHALERRVAFGLGGGDDGVAQPDHARITLDVGLLDQRQPDGFLFVQLGVGVVQDAHVADRVQAEQGPDQRHDDETGHQLGGNADLREVHGVQEFQSGIDRK